MSISKRTSFANEISLNQSSQVIKKLNKQTKQRLENFKQTFRLCGEFIIVFVLEHKLLNS